LHGELYGAGVPAFLDLNDIEPLDQFPTEIAEALLAANVVVVFADETYFTRRYCVSEFDAALAPRALVRGNAPPEEEDKALLHLVIALPEIMTCSWDESDMSRQPGYTVIPCQRK